MAGKVGTTTNLAVGMLDRGASYVGSKARDYASGFVSNVKGAFFESNPALSMGAGYASKVGKSMFGGSGTTFASAKANDNIRPVLLEQTRTLKEVAKNTASSNRIFLAYDKNQEKRTKEQTKQLAKELKNVAEAAESGNSGKIYNRDSRGRFRSSTISNLAIAGRNTAAAIRGFARGPGGAAGIAAGAGVGLLALGVPAAVNTGFFRPERRGESARRSSTSLRDEISSLNVTASGEVATGRSTGGTTIRSALKPIAVEDKKLRDATVKSLSDLKTVSSNVDKNTKISLENFGKIQRYQRRARKTQPVDERSTFEKQVDTANERFWKSFEPAITKVYEKGLTKALDLAGKVTVGQASGQFYIGQQLSKGTGLQKGTEKALTKLLGDEYGKMFAPMVSQLGMEYLQAGGQALGETLFGGTLGNERARTLTGQIIGNYQKGNKTTAYQQALYGLTGIATDPGSILMQYSNQFGYKSEAAGVSYIADVLGASTTATAQNMVGYDRTRPTYRDPKTGRMVPVDSFGAPFGSMSTATPGFNPNDPNSKKDVYDLSGTSVATVQGIDDIKRQEQLRDDIIAGNDAMESGFLTQEERLKQQTVVTAQGTQVTNNTLVGGFQGMMSGLGNLAQAIMGMGGGGGTSLSIGLGGMGGGGGMSPFGNMMVDLGASFATAALTKNIKNPALRAVASIGSQVALSAGAKAVLAGGGLSGGLSAASTALGLGSIGSLGSLADFGMAFSQTASGQVVLLDSTMANAGSFLASNPALPGYGIAVGKLLQGDVKGAAGAGVGAWGGAKAGAAIGNMIVPGIGGVVGGVIGGIAGAIGLGGLFGKKKKRPPPPQIVERAIQILGNNNPNAKTTLYSANNPDAGLIAFADTLLNVAFNTIKMFEQAGYQLTPITGMAKATLISAGADPSKVGQIHYIGMHINQYSNTRLRIHTKPYSGYKEGDHYFEYGRPQDTSGANVAKTASRIVKDITELYKKNNTSADAQKKMDELNAVLNKKSIYDLAQGTIFELRKMDKKVESGVLAKDIKYQEDISQEILREQQANKNKQNPFASINKYEGAIKQEMRDFGDSESSDVRPTGNLLVWTGSKYEVLTPALAQKMGLTIEQEKQYAYDSESGQKVETGFVTTRLKDTDIVSITSTGTVIRDVDKSGGLSEADYLAAIEKFGYSTVTGKDAPTAVSAVSDNSTTINNFGSMGGNDPLRNSSVSTRLPLAA